MASTPPPPTGPPGPDVSQAPLLIGVTGALHVVSWSLYAARIWTRSTPTFRLGLDDAFVTAAVMFDLASWSIMLVGTRYGVARHNYYVSPQDQVLAEKFLFISQPPYPWALAFAKLSIAWMLFRLRRDSRTWQVVMASVSVVAVGIAISANSFQLSMCTPLWAVWDHSNPDAKCMDPQMAQTSIYVNSGLTIATDVVLSLAPVPFIMSINRLLRERIVLVVIMGLGLIASAASIAKTTKVKDYGVTGDTLMDNVQITILSALEMKLAIIASCIPTLKQFFENLLRRVGVLTSTPRPPRPRSLPYISQGYLGLDKNDGPEHALSSLGSEDRASQPKRTETDSVESGLPVPESGRRAGTAKFIPEVMNR